MKEEDKFKLNKYKSSSDGKQDANDIDSNKLAEHISIDIDREFRNYKLTNFRNLVSSILYQF